MKCLLLNHHRKRKCPKIKWSHLIKSRQLMVINLRRSNENAKKINAKSWRCNQQIKECNKSGYRIFDHMVWVSVSPVKSFVVFYFFIFCVPLSAGISAAQVMAIQYKFLILIWVINYEYCVTKSLWCDLGHVFRFYILFAWEILMETIKNGFSLMQRRFFRLFFFGNIRPKNIISKNTDHTNKQLIFRTR